MTQRKLGKLMLAFVMILVLCVPAFAAETEHIHQPDGIWEVDDPDRHWQVCEECQEKILLGAHEWEDRSAVVKDPCTEDREELLVCRVCHRVQLTVYPAPGHSWDDCCVIQEATCLEKGIVEYRCTVCGETTQEEIPALSHEAGTQWESSASQHWHFCVNCGGKVDVANHFWTDWTLNGEHKEERSCKICGKTESREGPEAAHTPGSGWENNSSQHWQICVQCGKKVNSASHAWSNWVTGANQSQTRTCTVCGRVESRKNQLSPAADLVVMEGGKVVQKSFVRGGEAYAVAEDGAKLTVKSVHISFADVRPNMWHYNMVQFAAGHELLIGTSATTFGPDQSMTRAMLATVIYRLEGSPACGKSAFTDVSEDAWYAKAVTWAAEQGILNGVGNGRFAPNAPVKREEIVTILYRYAQVLKMDCSARKDLSGFSDSGSVSAYAIVPMEWATGTGLITGYQNGRLGPRGTATRAEVATMLQKMVVRITEETGRAVS